MARTITLVESTRAAATALLARLLPATGGCHRIGITGVPVVDESTFPEAFGTLALQRGHRLAVLAADPFSGCSGVSILSDRTRWEQLPDAPGTFIRPPPTDGTLGGVFRRTREAVLLCESAGFDVVFVETAAIGA